MREQIKNNESQRGRKPAMSLIWRIERFLRASGMPETRFGRLAVRDPRLVGDLRNGRQPRAGTVARIEAFIASREQAR